MGVLENSGVEMATALTRIYIVIPMMIAEIFRTRRNVVVSSNCSFDRDFRPYIFETIFYL